jgi:class 3 adenylate cyclase
MDNQVIFHGPRFKIGLASGSVVKKIPNPSTGRADYFGEPSSTFRMLSMQSHCPRASALTDIPAPLAAGPLLNHAARILSKAAGGQVLVDSPTWEAIQMEFGGSTGTLMAVHLGEFTLKGVEDTVCLYQVSDEVRASVFA